MSRINDPVSAGVILKSLPRAFDDLPIWAQLNITYKCNLDCAYCSEYDNSKNHVAYDDLIKRIDQVKSLGALHADLIGGEPLLHPELAPLMRHIVSRGMTTGMTTNGFLLTEEKLVELMDSGMGRIQMSVDALKPKPGVPKSLKTLRKKIEMVSRHKIWFRVNTVICDETLDEVEEVAKACWDLGVAINFSVVHDRGRLKKLADSPRYLERVQWLKDQKLAGKPISTPFYLIDYYERALEDRPMEWTCQGGSKCFYISAEGHFQYCYHLPSTTMLADVTRADLANNRGKKGCEENCGVDCVIHTSLPFSNRGDLVMLAAQRQINKVVKFLPILRS